ncbi:AAA family ATPase [Candidatus Dependentiae bacterium]|nr:AAA family ATPase [Candidatus Dependentiae bacterium]
MLKNKIFIINLFFIVNFSILNSNLFGNFWNNFQNNSEFKELELAHLNKKYQPSFKVKEIPVSGKNLNEILDIIGKNIDIYSKKQKELTDYIAQIEQIIKHSYFDSDRCRRELGGLKKNLEIINNKIKYYENLRISSTKGFIDNQTLKEKLKIEEEEKEKDRKADLKKATESIKAVINESLKKENLIKTGTFAVITTAGMISSYYGAKLGHKYVEALIGKPTLVRESNKLGFKQTMKNIWFKKILGRPEVPVKIEEVILNPELKTLLGDFAQETKKSYLNGLVFRNALFYGAPGTGKTMFAKRLAMFCNMDYAILSGADFSQFKNGEAITELHKFFDWANNSKRGLIVFIDEADSFLRNRKDLDNDAINLINAFLSRTGESSKKIMFIFATNYPEDLDPAVLSRIHKKINFTLPDLKEREQILNLYFKKYIIDDEKIVKKNGQKVINKINISPQINREFIYSIAQKVNGLSGRDIEQVVSELQIAAYIKGNGNLTKEIVTRVVDRKIKEFNQEKSWA